jgi:hypothetical protein
MKGVRSPMRNLHGARQRWYHCFLKACTSEEQ